MPIVPLISCLFCLVLSPLIRPTLFLFLKPVCRVIVNPNMALFRLFSRVYFGHSSHTVFLLYFGVGYLALLRGWGHPPNLHFYLCPFKSFFQKMTIFSYIFDVVISGNVFWEAIHLITSQGCSNFKWEQWKCCWAFRFPAAFQKGTASSFCTSGF